MGAERERIGGEEETNVGIGIHLPLHGGEKSRIGAFGYGAHAVGTANVNAHDPILERTADVVDALLQSGDGVQKLREMGGIWLEDIARGHIYIIIGIDESRQTAIGGSIEIDELEVVAGAAQQGGQVQVAARLRHVPPTPIANQERRERSCCEEVGKTCATLGIAGPVHAQADIGARKRQGGEYNAKPVAQSALRNYRDLFHFSLPGS